MFRSNAVFLTYPAVVALQACECGRSDAQEDSLPQRTSTHTPTLNQGKQYFPPQILPIDSIGHLCKGEGCYCGHNQKIVWRDQVDPQVEILVDGEIVGKIRANGPNPRATNIFFPDYGTEYEIRVSNKPMHHGFRTQTPERCLFDIEVDGLSVMNGRPRAGRPHGYIVKAGRSTTILGWRIDDQTVRRFVVARPDESVAAAENTMKQIGKIKVRVYRERPLPVTFHGGSKTGGMFQTKRSVGSVQHSNQFGSALSGYGAAGTGAGSQAQSQISRVTFQASPWPMQTIEFTYFVDEE